MIYPEILCTFSILIYEYLLELIFNDNCRGRIQMHCDVLVGEEVEVSNIPVIHEPPRRVFTRLPGTAGLAISDYLYPGEGNTYYY